MTGDSDPKGIGCISGDVRGDDSVRKRDVGGCGGDGGEFNKLAYICEKLPEYIFVK